MTIVTVSPHLKQLQVPQPLHDLPIWLVWRFEHQDNRAAKPRKVPYYASGQRRHGQQGSTLDRARMTTFAAAKEAAIKGGFDGVGIALLDNYGLLALDFDNCVTPVGLDPAVENLVGCTYAEFSPSGNGVRALFWGDIGNHKSPATPDRFGFETFSSSGFVTITGNHLPITDILGLEDTINGITEGVIALSKLRFGPGDLRTSAGDDDPLMQELPLGLTEQQLQAVLAALPDDLSYDEWLKVGMAIHFETAGEGFELWESWSQLSPKYGTREYNEERWNSFGRRSGRQVTARTLVQMANSRGAGINTTIAGPEEFEQATTEKPATEKLSRFPIFAAADFSGNAPLSYLIKGVLPKAELAVLYGESTAGKTFVAMDIGFAIARGAEWRGRRVKQGRVVYIAAEGVGGLRNRLLAYAQAHSIELAGLALDVIPAAPNLLEKADALEVAKVIASCGRAALVIVDTFAQCTPGGNENAGEDMGRALTHCKGIHKATGATVMLVHHAGKDLSRGARGWSGLRAAADAEIEIARSIAGRSIRLTKNKDGDDTAAWGFDLETITLGLDEDGDAITSCVVREAELPVVGVAGKARKLGVWESLVAEVMAEFSLGQLAGIEVDAVIAEVVRRAPAPADGKRDQRKACVRRALNNLCEGDDAPYLLEDDGTVTVL